MSLRAPHWFGIGLAAGLLFLWCLVSVIEMGMQPGWIWGLVIFGVIAIIALVMAAVNFWGGGTAGEDPLLRTSSKDRLKSHGETPRSTGDVPQSASGRSLT